MNVGPARSQQRLAILTCCPCVGRFGYRRPPAAQPRRATEHFEPYPTILVLATDGDSPDDWLHAGQALQRVLLTATWLNLATTPISQPVDIPALREL
jgi:hypothetical protein